MESHRKLQVETQNISLEDLPNKKILLNRIFIMSESSDKLSCTSYLLPNKKYNINNILSNNIFIVKNKY